MSEEQKLNQARDFIAENNVSKASEILWELYQSTNQDIKLNAILGLLVILDHWTEYGKLLELIEEGLKITPMLSEREVEAYLLNEKCNFLQIKLSLMIHRQKNLKLSENVFDWIGFSTEQEQKEFEAIALQRKETEREIQKLETTVLDILKVSNNHKSKGNIFSRLGEFYNSKFFDDKLDLMIGGKIRAKIGNIYFVRRWKLDKWFLYNSKDRKKIKDDWNKCLYFFKLAISELKSEEYGGDRAHVYYNLAVKYKFIFKFNKAKRFLKQAQALAEKHNEKRLFSQIMLLRKNLVDKNKNIRNYVEEFGLDLP